MILVVPVVRDYDSEDALDREINTPHQITYKESNMISDTPLGERP